MPNRRLQLTGAAPRFSEPQRPSRRPRRLSRAFGPTTEAGKGPRWSPRGARSGGGISLRADRTSEVGMPTRPERDSYEGLKQLIHRKLVEKLDPSTVSRLAGNTLRLEVRLVIERLVDTEN